MKISNDVLGVLSALEFPTATSVKIVERLDRQSYSKVNQVMEAIGGKWNKKAQAHVFGEDAQPLVDRVIDTGEVSTNKDIGFFPTPPELATSLVAMADVRQGQRVLEPSAGTGRIVDAILAKRPELVTAIERDAKMRAALIASSRGRSGLWVTDCDDFMDYCPMYGGDAGRKRVDRVVMNPPFLRSGKGDHLDHVRHAHDMLERDGILVSVLPSSVTFRRDRRHTEFREWISGLGGETRVLPPGSFKESGTDVNTVVVRIPA